MIWNALSLQSWHFSVLLLWSKLGEEMFFNLLRYQLLPPSSPFSLARRGPLKFSLDRLGGLLKEVPRTLPNGRIWANLINLGSPITDPLFLHWPILLESTRAFCHFYVLDPMVTSELAFYCWETVSLANNSSFELNHHQAPNTALTF